MSEKKQDEDELPGIGHNQGPAIDQVPLPESDNLNLGREAKSISAGGITHGAITNTEDAPDIGVVKPSQYGSAGVAFFEDRMAAGGYSQGGKHIANDTLVSRRGYRRILPESKNREEIEADLEKLDEIAKQVLHGRNAAMFEKMVIGPLKDGVPKPPIEDVAAEFNVTAPRARKIIDKCWDWISEALPRFKAGTPLLEKDRSPVCSICGRHESSTTMCPRGNDGACDRRPYGRNMNSRSVPDLSAADLEAARRDMEEEDRENAKREQRWRDHLKEAMRNWEEKYGPKRRPRLSEFFRAPKRNAK